MGHPEFGTLLDSAAGRASPETLMDVDEHIADCPECAQRLRALSCLRGDFDRWWDLWTSPRESVSASKTCTEPVTAQIAEDNAGLDAFLKSVKLKAEVLLLQSKRLVVLAANLPEGFSQVLQPAVAGVASAEALQLHQTLLDAGVLLLCGEREEAMCCAERASEIDKWSTQTAELDLLEGGKLVAKVVADARKKRILVLGWPTKTTPLLGVLLVPTAEQGVPRYAPMQSVSGADYRLAEFRDVEEHLYTVYLCHFCPEQPIAVLRK